MHEDPVHDGDSPFHDYLRNEFLELYVTTTADPRLSKGYLRSAIVMVAIAAPLTIVAIVIFASLPPGSFWYEPGHYRGFRATFEGAMTILLFACSVGFLITGLLVMASIRVVRRRSRQLGTSP